MDRPLTFARLVAWARRKFQSKKRLMRRSLYRFRSTRTVRAGGTSVRLRTRTPWEYERAAGGFERFPIERLIETGLDRSETVYYEIGACTGIASSIVGRLLDSDRLRVVAFEPEPSNAAAIAENFRLNGLTNALVVPVALSDADGTTTLHFDNPEVQPGQGGHSLSIDHGRGGLPALRLTLDSAMRVFGLPAPTVMTIDAEGHEISVLAGMRRLLSDPSQPVKMIVIEIEGTRNPWDSEVVATMKRLGYDVSSYLASPETVRPDCLVAFTPAHSEGLDGGSRTS